MKAKEKGQSKGEDAATQSPTESARRDLANRYQSMVNTQFTALSNFEDKAWRTVRATVALIGVYLTGLSLLVKFGGSNVDVGLIDILPALLGTASLICSLYFSILVLASTKVGFGPSKKLGTKMNKQNLSEADYDGLLLQNYWSTIQANWVAIGDKSVYLRRSLACLLFGLIQVTLGLFFVIAPNPLPIKGLFVKGVIFLGVLVVAAYVAGGIWKENSEKSRSHYEGDTDSEGSGSIAS